MAKSTTEAAKPSRKSSDKIKQELGVPYERQLIDDPDNDDPGPVPAKSEYNISQQVNELRFPKIEILKGKILKGDKVEIEYTRRDNLEEKPARCTYEHTAPPRQQLKKAFACLSVHAALLGEFIPLTSIEEILEPDPELIKDFNVSGFTIIGSDDNEGVILTAQKTLKSGKILGLNIPIIRFNDESENSYPHLQELSDAVDMCKDEMSLYLAGSHAPNPQQELPFE